MDIRSVDEGKREARKIFENELEYVPPWNSLVNSLRRGLIEGSARWIKSSSLFPGNTYHAPLLPTPHRTGEPFRSAEFKPLDEQSRRQCTFKLMASRSLAFRAACTRYLAPIVSPLRLLLLLPSRPLLHERPTTLESFILLINAHKLF